jgi:type IV pilus assembly protein PilA
VPAGLFFCDPPLAEGEKMSDAVWYYVDRQRQRNGPVTAAAVAEAYGFGWVDDSSLVWRDGLGAWTPLANHRAELGIVGPPAVAAAQAGYPAPARKSGGSGCLIAVVAVGLGGVFILSVLAAIAIPAYHDYLARAQVTTALADIRGGVTAVEEILEKDDGCPAGSEEIGLTGEIAHEKSTTFVTVGEIAPRTCWIEARTVGGEAAVDGATIRLTRNEATSSWRCTVDGTEHKYLPTGCDAE